MPRYSALRLTYDQNAVFTEQFFRILASIGNAADLRTVYLSLFTPSEIVMLMRRLKIAHLLFQGIDYRGIAKRLGVGNPTIKSVMSRLSRLQGGFETVARIIDEIEDEVRTEISREIENMDPHSRERLIRKYSGYHGIELMMRDAPRHVRELRAASQRKGNRKKKS